MDKITLLRDAAGLAGFIVLVLDVWILQRKRRSSQFLKFFEKVCAGLYQRNLTMTITREVGLVSVHMRLRATSQVLKEGVQLVITGKSLGRVFIATIEHDDLPFAYRKYKETQYVDIYERLHRSLPSRNTRFGCAIDRQIRPRGSGSLLKNPDALAKLLYEDVTYFERGWVAFKVEREAMKKLVAQFSLETHQIASKVGEILASL